MYLFSLLLTVIVIVVFLVWFVRKPIRSNIHNFKIVSPCDGKIMSVENNHISVFLSVFDVHWQYVPINSVVKSIKVIHGSHNMAFNPESSHNEGIKVIFQSEIGDISVTQRVGFFVRRIQNTITIKDSVRQSEPYGIIRFGSRVDIELPKHLSTKHLKVGDKLTGGVSALVI